MHRAALVAAAATLALLAACGQKGPLFLPQGDPASVRPVERLPSAPDDGMPHAPPVPPSPDASSPGLPSGVFH